MHAQSRCPYCQSALDPHSAWLRWCPSCHVARTAPLTQPSGDAQSVRIATWVGIAVIVSFVVRVVVRFLPLLLDALQ